MNNRISSFIYTIILTLLFSSVALGQIGTVKGVVIAEDGTPLLGASIGDSTYYTGTTTDQKGNFVLKVPANKQIIIFCYYMGYKSVFDTINLKKNQEIYREFRLVEDINFIEGVDVVGYKPRQNSMITIDLKAINQLPIASGNMEDLIKTFQGVTSNNELSSQYSVRGGNFDENLIYVNDIEVHRPLLVQSAKQEGLSFINPNMVAGIQFSAGGFEAEYGDKLSSVLDIQYLKPTEFKGHVGISLLGANLNFAGVGKNKKLSYNTGIRYKTTKYLLGSLDVSGEYMPQFGDVQTLFTYDFTPKSSLSFLGNYSTNQYSLVPVSRSTDFGSLVEALNFTVYYEGQEYDKFDSYLGALSYVYRPHRDLSLKFIASAFETDEQITYDIISDYWISQISRTSSNKDTSINIGTGGSLEHARNYLDALIRSLEHKGFYSPNDINALKWGVKFQYEEIHEELNEWRIIDSTGLTTPAPDDAIGYDYSRNASNYLSSFRYQAFFQHTYKLYADKALYSFTYGVRGNYWDYNKEMLISPRVTLAFEPFWNKKVNFYLATGLYQQPPFYKELKSYTGQLFPERRAQKSIHFVFGTDFHYKWWNRPFIFSSELYYKHLYDIIPYKVENIEVEYMPIHRAHGYAAGLDMRVSGEFVEGVDSWFSLSLMKTMEDSYNDFFKLYTGEVVYPSYYRRPSDQRITFSIFFQDYLPANKDYKVHLLLNYGSGLPYSGPIKDRPSEVYVLNQYRRVDIGFSRNISRKKNTKIGFNDIWISFEILNLLGAKNMSSYDWVKTVENNEGYRDYYAVPNYLTNRRFNVKISSNL